MIALEDNLVTFQIPEQNTKLRYREIIKINGKKYVDYAKTWDLSPQKFVSPVQVEKQHIRSVFIFGFKVQRENRRRPYLF